MTHTEEIHKIVKIIKGNPLSLPREIQLANLLQETNSKWKQAVQKLKEDKRFKFDDLDKVIIDEILGELTQ